MPADGQLRGVVVGVGHLGRHHARLLKEVEGVSLLGVVDPDETQGGAVAKDLGVTHWKTLEDLPEVDLACVAVPTPGHHEVVIPLLRAGAHVLVEKPMASTVEEAEEMASVADEEGRVLRVGHIERFNPVLSVFRDMDVTPRFIEAHRLAPFNFRAVDVSVVMDLMIHDLDIVMELAGSPLVRSEGVGSAFLGRHVDMANARLTFESGCVANVTASRVSFEPMRRTRVFGRETFVSMDFGSRRAFVVTMAEGFDPRSLSAIDQDRFTPTDSFKEFVQQGLMNLQEIDMDESNPLLLEITAFVKAVRGEEEGGVSAEDGLRAMRVAEDLHRSMESHAWAEA
ncbi:MAG: Gfo/Idh/MocA family oxidoreductase [Planctomycetota bacterium]|nr:Gfo/Idh/MocA family oxidoreductase [Planctomycetota bacterium]